MESSEKIRECNNRWKARQEIKNIILKMENSTEDRGEKRRRRKRKGDRKITKLYLNECSKQHNKQKTAERHIEAM